LELLTPILSEWFQGRSIFAPKNARPLWGGLAIGGGTTTIYDPFEPTMATRFPGNSTIRLLASLRQLESAVALRNTFQVIGPL